MGVPRDRRRVRSQDLGSERTERRAAASQRLTAKNPAGGLWQSNIDLWQETARFQLGDSTYAAEYAKGQGMSLDEAIQDAVGRDTP